MSALKSSGSITPAHRGIDTEKLLDFIDEAYDTVEVWDSSFRLLYISESCFRTFGYHFYEIEGKTLTELTSQMGAWSPSMVPFIAKSGKQCMQRQVSRMGIPYRSIGIPIMDEKGKVEYIVISSREEYEILTRQLTPVLVNAEAHSIPGEGEIRFSSPAMQNIIRLADKVALSDAPCLLLGETGTGKSMLAKHIHANSNRRKKDLITINMASMNPNLIESELFGYAKGSFTGAEKGGKKGLFAKADGGTLFLDEIGELPLDLQAKFLHVLQEGVYTPVGSTETIPVNVRILSATNKPLHELVKSGKFREDLYYRLNIFELLLPPLRERPGDLELLLTHFLQVFNLKYKCDCTFDEETLAFLQAYSWPGNIRELSNIVERCVVMAENNLIQMNDVPEHLRKDVHHNVEFENLSDITDLEEALAEYEKRIIRYHYQKHGSSRKLAAALNLSPTTARRKINKYLSE